MCVCVGCGGEGAEGGRRERDVRGCVGLEIYSVRVGRSLVSSACVCVPVQYLSLWECICSMYQMSCSHRC